MLDNDISANQRWQNFIEDILRWRATIPTIHSNSDRQPASKKRKLVPASAYRSPPRTMDYDRDAFDSPLQTSQPPPSFPLAVTAVYEDRDTIPRLSAKRRWNTLSTEGQDLTTRSFDFMSSRTTSERSSRRSQSPTKSKLTDRERRLALADARPQITFEASAPVGREPSFTLPPQVLATINVFHDDFTCDEYIPAVLQPKVAAECPGQPLRQAIFTTSLPSDHNPDILHDHILSCVALTSYSYAVCDSEDTWYDYITKMVNGPNYAGLPRWPIDQQIFLVKGQAKYVVSELLPITPVGIDPIGSVRTDLLLQFSKTHDQAKAFYNDIRASYPGIKLSPVSALDQIIACPIEVKGPHGNYLEASNQIAVTSAAALERIYRFINTDIVSAAGRRRAEAFARCIPIPGITIIGHEWKLHWTFTADGGGKIVMGPYNFGNSSTILSMYRLEKALVLLKAWIISHYWPWVKSCYE